MAPMAGVLGWKDGGSLGRTGGGNKEGASPLMLVTCWSARSSVWGWMRSQRAGGPHLNGGKGQVTL